MLVVIHQEKLKVKTYQIRNGKDRIRAKEMDTKFLER